MKEKKIIFVSYDLNPNMGSEAGRAAEWLRILSRKYFIEAFTQVVHKRDIAKDDFQNVSFTFIYSNRVLRNFLIKIGFFNILYCFFINKVKKELKKKNLNDYFLIHCITPAGVFSYNDLYKLKLPVLIGPIGGGLMTPKGFERIFNAQPIRNFLRNFFYKYLLKNAAWRCYLKNSVKIIIGLESVKDILPEDVWKKCIVIPNGIVDTAYFKPALDRRNEQVAQILFVGSLESKKGLMLLIDAAHLCVQSGIENFIIKIIGKGPLKTKAESRIRNYSLNNKVILYGYLSKQQILKNYQGSDIFCLPTIREPFSNSILEAMASGLPIITSDYGGPKYIVTEECGIRIKLINYEQYVFDLARAIENLITNVEIRKTMGVKARERVEKEFSLKIVENKILNIYDKILN
jgi:glycosyltransferase involved in cell wall biosynthesis